MCKSKYSCITLFSKFSSRFPPPQVTASRYTDHNFTTAALPHHAPQSPPNNNSLQLHPSINSPPTTKPQRYSCRYTTPTPVHLYFTRANYPKLHPALACTTPSNKQSPHPPWRLSIPSQVQVTSDWKVFPWYYFSLVRWTEVLRYARWDRRKGKPP